MKYNNFNASIYCPVDNLMSITDFDEFDCLFDLIMKNIKVGKVYLETFRGNDIIDRSQMILVKEYFEKKGIATAGGITPVGYSRNKEGGFPSLCYSTPEIITLLKEVITLTAELFDEIILDDFYFNNCRCNHCIKEKGTQTWSEYRLSKMQYVSEHIFIKTAKDVNPNVKLIIKYPNWYEHYQETGYNLAEETKVFDYIYSGTETRNPSYAQQHLPKYLSYFIMRYLENVAANRNLGGWFDPYECTYNLTSYLDQGYLTLFGKAKEAMLFSLGSLIQDKSYTTFPPAIGQAFTDMDGYLGQLGNPIGISSYLPYHSYGEDYLHNYLGMCGLPLEPYPEYPSDAKTILLTESASFDDNIVSKIQFSLKKGADILVTSGLVKRLGKDFTEFMNVSYTDKKAAVQSYLHSNDGGITIGGKMETSKSIIIPQLHYFTNDVWELMGAYGEDNNFPILLKTTYGNGRIFVLTIPDDMGNIYHYPTPLFNSLRTLFSNDLPVVLEGNAKITLFTYDNNTFILRSFLSYMDQVTVRVKGKDRILRDLETNQILKGLTMQEETRFDLNLQPGINHVFQIVSL